MSSGLDRRAKCYYWLLKTSKDHRLSPPRLEAKRKDHQRCKKNQAPGIFVNEELAQETLDKREEQRPKFEEARRNGKIAYFVVDRLVIKDRLERPS